MFNFVNCIAHPSDQVKPYKRFENKCQHNFSKGIYKYDAYFLLVVYIST